jgi:hypothetical protein
MWLSTIAQLKNMLMARNPFTREYRRFREQPRLRLPIRGDKAAKFDRARRKNDCGIPRAIYAKLSAAYKGAGDTRLVMST